MEGSSKMNWQWWRWWRRLAQLVALFGPNRVSRWIWENKVLIRVHLGNGSPGIIDNWHLSVGGQEPPDDQIWLASAKTGRVVAKIVNIGNPKDGGRAED